MSHRYKRIWTVVATAFLMLLAGCATIEGAGKDIQSAGEAIEEAAEK
jgi:predicted small secreted protein